MIQIFTTYTDEQDILASIANGQKQGLEWLYKHCFATTRTMVLKMQGSEDEAWDVFQEAVVLFYHKTSTEGITLNNCRINTYITSVTRNIWLKKFSKKNTVAMPDGWDGGPAEESNIAAFLQKEADIEKLELAMDTLGDPCSKLLKAFYFDGKSMQDITTLFGYTNAENAKTQKYKCLTRLKKIFFNHKVETKTEE